MLSSQLPTYCHGSLQTSKRTEQGQVRHWLEPLHCRGTYVNECIQVCSPWRFPPYEPLPPAHRRRAQQCDVHAVSNDPSFESWATLLLELTVVQWELTSCDVSGPWSTRSHQTTVGTPSALIPQLPFHPLHLSFRQLYKPSHSFASIHSFICTMFPSAIVSLALAASALANVYVGYHFFPF